jgi:uncharacterized RDD family membrane protein YckC
LSQKKWFEMRVRREPEALSTSLSQPDPTFSWKQEVSRRIAAHQSHRGLSTAEFAEPAQSWAAAGSRAAMVAARVAARYANAPSFSQMQAAEAHAALRAAEVATHAALEANVAAQAALAGLQDAPATPQQWEPVARPSAAPARTPARDWEPTLAPARPTAPSSLEAWENEYSRLHWEPDPRLRPAESTSAPAAAPSPRQAEAFTPSADDRWEWPSRSEESWGNESIEPVEPAQPINANLIEFPRELVATRKMRPRRAEGPFAEQAIERQLSIFEVDPGDVATEPEIATDAPVSDWQKPEWSSIELEAQSQDEPEPQDAPAPRPDLHLAPIRRRFMAVLVDGVLIAAALLLPALMAVAKIGHPPTAKIMEAAAVSAFLLAGLLYQTLFLTLVEATPGMKCARLSLCTFDGQIPTREQLHTRLGALLLSVVPVGLGVAWALFDDDHLCWHDRLSRTYLRKY